MADYIYDAAGDPQGFRLSNYIYLMDGTPVGRVWAEKAYTLEGDYVGALINNMVLDKPDVSRRRLPAVAVPDDAVPPGRAEPRRPLEGAFADVFHLFTHQQSANDAI